MKWITRARPNTDRIASSWLIRQFIDPLAEILYVPDDQVLAVAELEEPAGSTRPAPPLPAKATGASSRFSSTTSNSTATRRWPGWPTSFMPPRSPPIWRPTPSPLGWRPSVWAVWTPKPTTSGW